MVVSHKLPVVPYHLVPFHSVERDTCTTVNGENNIIFSVILNLSSGLCVHSSHTDYDKHGSSDQCFEGNSETMCASGSMLCGGNQKAANFVYTISHPGTYFFHTSSSLSSSDLREDLH